MPAFNWKRVLPSGDLTVTAGQIPDDWLSHINTAVTANSGASDAYWEVANYASVSPKSVLLRRKDGSAGRIIIFGQNGSTPSSLATRNATTSLLYIGFSASSTANTPDASWISAAPLSATDYMLAVPMWQMTASTTWRLSYWEFPDGMYFGVTLGTTTGHGAAAGGWLVEDLMGNVLPSILGTGSQTLPTEPFPSGIATAGIVPPLVSNNTTTATANRMLVRVDGFDETIYRIFSAVSAATGKLADTVNKRAFFFPIHMSYGTNDVRRNVCGKLRQVAFGPNTTREATLEATGSPSVYAYGHAYHNASSVPAMWFTNFEV
jgi:hypothetical protein